MARQQNDHSVTNLQHNIIATRDLLLMIFYEKIVWKKGPK